jgi:hypothetical protein
MALSHGCRRLRRRLARVRHARPAVPLGPLPLPAALYGVLVFPFIWGLTEQMTYGYLVPGFQVLRRSTGLAVAIVAFVWSSYDAAMHDGGPGHVEQPTSEQAVTQRGGC